DLGDAVRADALDEAPDGQILGADALERREQTAEHEVAPAHRSCALDGHEVVDARDDAKQPGIALRVEAHLAHSAALADLCDVAAALAGPELVAQRTELVAQRAGESVVGRQEPEDVALGGLLPDARKAREELDEALDLGAHLSGPRCAARRRTVRPFRGS